MKKILAIIFLLQSVLYSQDLHYRNKELPCANKKFQLSVHIVLDSLRKPNFTKADLESALLSSNKFFAPICMSFDICCVDTLLLYNYSYDRLDSTKKQTELLNKYHDDNRINLYIVDFILQEEICGLASFGAVNDPTKAYVFLKKACPGSLTHELGHLFGLLHTFEGNGTENADGSNCLTEGDLICDTPADPYIPFEPLKQYIRDCEFINTRLDKNGDYYQPQVGNIMSYYGCDCGFSRGQYLKMYDTYIKSAFKNW